MQYHFLNLVGKRFFSSAMFPISFVTFLLIFGESIISPIFSIYVNSITNNLFLTGIVLSMLGIVGILVSIPMGILADKFKLKTIIMISTATYIVTPLIYVWYPTLNGLLVARILSSLMSTLLWCAMWSYIYSKIDPNHRGHGIGVATKAMDLGSSMAPIIGGFVALLSFLLPFYIFSAISLVALLVIFFFLPDIEQQKMDSFAYLFKKDVDILKYIFKRYKMIILMGIVAFSIITAVGGFLPILLKQQGLSYFTIGGVISLSILPVFFLETEIGDLTDRIGRAKSMALSLVVFGLISVLFSISIDMVLLVPLIILFGFANSFAFISFSSIMSEWSNDHDRGLLSGVRKSLMSIGVAAGPFFTGILLSFGGVQVTMAVFAAVCLTTALVFFFSKENLFEQQTTANKKVRTNG
ncbi:MAG: MFS transporter [Candidatus Nanoarchaeia archaeon]|nr:MFS transporter [Candidatus Nanoarchaeia archaeon]MDD5239140.1 MFS transporter [Candidatus Nanoarchaeia archaeon]